MRIGTNELLITHTGNQTCVSKISLLLCSLLCQNVTFKSVFSFDFTCSGMYGCT